MIGPDRVLRSIFGMVANVAWYLAGLAIPLTILWRPWTVDTVAALFTTALCFATAATSWSLMRRLLPAFENHRDPHRRFSTYTRVDTVLLIGGLIVSTVILSVTHRWGTRGYWVILVCLGTMVRCSKGVDAVGAEDPFQVIPISFWTGGVVTVLAAVWPLMSIGVSTTVAVWCIVCGLLLAASWEVRRVTARAAEVRATEGGKGAPAAR